MSLPLEVFELIRKLASAGKTIAKVVHDLVSACRYADHLVAMKAGAIVAQGEPGAVVTPELIRLLYHIDCELTQDPITGAPLLVNVRRADLNGRAS